MFETTGQVELAEILYDGTRSKGCGVVQFAQVPEAETAIGTCRYSLFLPRGSSSSVYTVQPSSSNTCMAVDLSVSALACMRRICASGCADFLAQTCGSTIAGTRSPRAPQRAARPFLCKPTVLCKSPWQCLLVFLCRARISSMGSPCFPYVSVPCKPAIIHHCSLVLLLRLAVPRCRRTVV